MGQIFPPTEPVYIYITHNNIDAKITCIMLSFISEPNVSLPVDNIINSILQGSISGDVSGEITIVPRGAGSGLEFDGVSGYVDFGMHHDECFQSPDACKDGVTFCMWLWMGNSDSPKVLILDSGGYLHARAGYNMRLGNGVLYVTVKFGDKNKHQYKVNDWNQDHWEHVAWTWHPAKGIRFFLNGCDTDPGATKGMSSHKKLNDLQPSNDASFVLGATSRTHVKMAKMKLDDLYIWYQVFTEHEIWMVYVNGETNFLAWWWRAIFYFFMYPLNEVNLDLIFPIYHTIVWFNIRMLSYHYWKPRCGDKTAAIV